MGLRARAEREERWQDTAACRGTDPNIFIPDGPGGNLNKAKSICAQCPWTGESGPCAQEAAAHGEQGVWGGVVFSTRTDQEARELILNKPIQDARPKPAPRPRNLKSV